jgi:fatty acid synthase subunit alpha
MVRLMYVGHQKRWVDRSLRDLTGDWLRRVEERFAGAVGGVKASILQNFTELDDPTSFVSKFLEKYPLATEQLVGAEDKAYFLTICQRPGQKPVPFIPILDATFEVWFKKVSTCLHIRKANHSQMNQDSLWAAEDIEAVFDQDPQRVCILQGPVAVKHATVKDQPIKEMLGGINDGLIKKLLQSSYRGDKSQVPVADYLGARPTPASIPAGVKEESKSNTTTYTIGRSVPATDNWLEALAGPKLSWLRAFLTSVTIIQGTSYVDNPLRRIFAPRAGQKVIVSTSGDVVTSIALHGGIRSHGQQKSDFKAVEAKFDQSTGKIALIINENRRDSSVPLHLQFQYRPDTGFAPIHEVGEGRNHRIKEFYWRLWFGDDEVLPEIDVRDTFTGPEVTISAEDIETFCDVVGNQGESFRKGRSENVTAPMDFAIVAGWQAIMKAIFPKSIDGDLLKLVHLSNGFRMVDGAAPLKAGDVCVAKARIASVSNTDAGKAVKVQGFIIREGKRVIEVTSSFLYRGRFSDFNTTFELTEEPEYLVEIATDVDVGVLLSKEWFEWDDDSKPLEAGSKLIFKVRSETTQKSKNVISSLAVVGEVFVRGQLKRLHKVATIDYDEANVHGNPVLGYLTRHGKTQGLTAPLSNEGYSLTANATTTFTTPATNEPYSKVSGDFNPIHINPYFSDFASLPGTITHGMWSSAATRRYIETVVAEGRPERVAA